MNLDNSTMPFGSSDNGSLPKRPIEPIEPIEPVSATQQSTSMASSSPYGMAMPQQYQNIQQPFWGGQWLNAIGQQMQLCEWPCGASKKYIEKSALIEQEALARRENKKESAKIEIAKAEILMRSRENRAIERQARVAKVELSPEGVPLVAYKRVELPDLKCHLSDCSLKSCIFYPDDAGALQSDGILVVTCTNQEKEQKKIFFKLRDLTGKKFRTKLMQNGIGFQAPNRKANDLAELLVEVLIRKAEKVQVPTRLGWGVKGYEVIYVRERELIWMEVVSHAKD